MDENKQQTNPAEMKSGKLYIGIAAAAVVVLALVLILTLGGKGQPAEEPTLQPEPTEEPVAPEATAEPVPTEAPAPEVTPEPSEPESQEEPGWNGEIETPVGTLYFPAEWRSLVEMKDELEGETYTAAFSTRIGETEVPLFALTVGDDESGYLLGKAPDAEKVMRTIWLDIRELEMDPAWDEDDVERLNLLQSCVNDLIEQIYELPGFDTGVGG